MNMYDLTPYTYHAEKGRKVSLPVVREDVSRASVWAFVGGAVVGLPFAVIIGLVLPFVGIFAGIVPIITGGAATWAFAGHSSQGMKASNWDRLRSKSKGPQYFVNLQPYDPSAAVQMGYLHDTATWM